MNTKTTPTKIKTLNQLFLSGLGEVASYKRYIQKLTKYNGKLMYTGSVHVNYRNGITQVFDVVDENGDVIETAIRGFMLQHLENLLEKIKKDHGDSVEKLEVECLD